MNRLGESKGAIELMLADSYAKRDFVSLISFRDTSAEILLLLPDHSSKLKRDWVR